MGSQAVFFVKINARAENQYLSGVDEVKIHQAITSGRMESEKN
jgi:hypothetical protein